MKTLLYILISLATPIVMGFIVNAISHDGWDLLGFGVIALSLLYVSVVLQQIILIFIFTLSSKRSQFPFIFTTVLSSLMTLAYFYWTYVMWHTYKMMIEMIMAQPNPPDTVSFAKLHEENGSPFLDIHLLLLLPLVLQVIVWGLRWRRRRMNNPD